MQHSIILLVSKIQQHGSYSVTAAIPKNSKYMFTLQKQTNKNSICLETTILKHYEFFKFTYDSMKLHNNKKGGGQG